MQVALHHNTNHSYNHVFFSPHLDDAALSCAGTIYECSKKGETVLVVTVFSGSRNVKKRIGGAFSAFADMESRRREDEKAMAVLQADFLWLSYEEAIQRDRRYQSLIGLVAGVADSDDSLLRTLEVQLNDICAKNPSAQLYFPLGVGNHADHLILYALSKKIGETDSTRNRMFYYEEVPYCFVPILLDYRLSALLRRREKTKQAIRKSYTTAMQFPFIRDNVAPVFRPVLFLLMQVFAFYLFLAMLFKKTNNMLQPELSDITDSILTKMQAADCYRSQTEILFTNTEAFRQMTFSYANQITRKSNTCFERRWRFA